MFTNVVHADVSHAAIIASIGKKSFRTAFEHVFKNRVDMLEYLEYTYDPVKLAKSLRKENNIYLLAYHGNEPAGFAKVKKHSLNDEIESGAQMELQKIYVLPAFQAMGIGSALMKEIKLIAKFLYPDYIWLDAHIGNEHAIRFYERHGFQKIGSDFLTIGSQSFEYLLMGIRVASNVTVGSLES